MNVPENAAAALADKFAAAQVRIGGYVSLGLVTAAERDLIVTVLRSQTETRQQLEDEYKSWCADQGLPHISAEELIHDNLLPTIQQRKWLAAFMDRWDRMEWREQRC